MVCSPNLSSFARREVVASTGLWERGAEASGIIPPSVPLLPRRVAASVPTPSEAHRASKALATSPSGETDLSTNSQAGSFCRSLRCLVLTSFLTVTDLRNRASSCLAITATCSITSYIGDRSSLLLSMHAGVCFPVYGWPNFAWLGITNFCVGHQAKISIDGGAV